MKNTKKIFVLLILSILFQTKNVKPISRETVEKIHATTSLITSLHYYLPIIASEFEPKLRNHPKWPDLIIERKIHNIDEGASLRIYAPLFITRILAASLDKNLDETKNVTIMRLFLILLDRIRNKNEGIATSLAVSGIFTSKTLAKSFASKKITEKLENRKISKRITKIIILSGLDITFNLLHRYVQHIVDKIKYKNINYPIAWPYSTSFEASSAINSLAKNIVIETLGEVIQRFLIDDEKSEETKHINQQIDNMMNNNELVLKLKNNKIETKPIEIK